MWKYCDSIFQLGFFIFYIVFLSFISFSPIHISFLFSFSCFSPPHKCLVSTPISISPSFIFFFTSRTFQQTHLLHIRERERERERETAACLLPHRWWRLRSLKGQNWWRSAFTMQHYHVHCPTAARPRPHHRVGLDWLVLFFFFFPICLFWFNFILRIGFCFVFCILIMWEMERMREKMKFEGERKN